VAETIITRAGAASNSRSVVTFAVNQPRQALGVGRGEGTVQILISVADRRWATVGYPLIAISRAEKSRACRRIRAWPHSCATVVSTTAEPVPGEPVRSSLFRRLSSQTLGALTVRVDSVQSLVGHGESRRQVHPAPDDLDVTRRFAGPGPGQCGVEL
jgi:hypothetical protein